MKLKQLLTSILITIFIFSCSSNSDDNENPPEETNFIITSISPLNGAIGDTVIISWSGLENPVNTALVKFNGIDSQVINLSDNQLSCMVPENATTGKIQLILNDTGVFSEQDFIVESGENPLDFSITTIIPNIPRPGYKMTIQGEGFGSSPEAISIQFKNIQEDTLEAKILTINNNEIQLAVPTNAISNTISISIDNESLSFFQEISEIEHKGLYFFQDGLIRTFNYNIDNYLLLANYSSNSFFDELYSFTYNEAQNVFYGFNHISNQTTTLRHFEYNDNNNQWDVNSICSNNGTGTACSDDFAVVTNTALNKNYYVERYEDSFVGLSFKEINSQGATETQHDFPNIDTIGFTDNNIMFIESINSFVFVENGLSSMLLHRIDANTFNLTSISLSGTIGTIEELFSQLHFDVSQDRLFVARQDDIYSIDYINFTATSLDTDWYNYIDDITGSQDHSVPYNFIYYEPTNDFYIDALIPNNGQRIFAINVLTKETRSIHGSSYGSGGRVFDWFVKN